MKKPALRNNRFKKKYFRETSWTKNSKNIGEYIFRRISIDQSDKDLQNIRPVHQMRKLVITSKEINAYVSDYLRMVDGRTNNIHPEKMSSELSIRSTTNKIPKYLG